MLEILLKLDALQMIEEMKHVMHASKRRNPICRDLQLRSGIRASGPTLQRQQTRDDLQTIDEPVLELLGQHVLTPQEVQLLTK